MIENQVVRKIKSGFERPIKINVSGVDIAVQKWDSAKQDAMICDHLYDVVKFHRFYNRCKRYENDMWAAHTPYPWITSLTQQETRIFAGELWQSVLLTIETGDVAFVQRTLHFWKTTSSILTGLNVRIL